ncbi:response regulator [Rhizobium hidalgonense]|uniref:Response regulator n=1 Tax=Rhizobium hidalgonense TaxID=1538159 RepID=A0A2A6K941_9HYPH|nr:response regulator [Rhizobium hidalgonense]MDR9776001.1 response regulator [Rhizobium hidalgonense]MDR9814108.1 response regulator [Rhizobium hidalgonense]MDR9820808.1 response regulator [Rhizobium hidalgonense]PDT20971.1 response regulator [Rhizobium hidalgonense]PON07202.1 response regulator receiver protein [Rhizobium hidalgonense]
MAEGILRGWRVLVVEDEFMLAEDLCQELAEAGAVVIGPAQSLERAMELLAVPDGLDAAVLDVNLQGKQVFPVADALLERQVPFVFTTGYDASVLPARFVSMRCCAKPLDMPRLMETLRSAITISPRP